MLFAYAHKMEFSFISPLPNLSCNYIHFFNSLSLFHRQYYCIMYSFSFNFKSEHRSGDMKFVKSLDLARCTTQQFIADGRSLNLGPSLPHFLCQPQVARRKYNIQKKITDLGGGPKVKELHTCYLSELSPCKCQADSSQDLFTVA